MHITVQNLIDIQKKINSCLDNIKINKLPKVIAVSKTFSIDKINPLIEHGHLDFGENKVQEAIDKWSDIKFKNKNINLHLIGSLQTNKVKFAVKLFDYIHSVDNEKLAKKISNEQEKQTKKVKIFIKVNIGNEKQKSGVNKTSLPILYSYCKQLNLDVIGLMCIPPHDKSAKYYFEELNNLNKELGLKELSMGMSADFIDAVKSSATYLRIGSTIFGKRS
jgi:PLP dependent protein